MSGFPKYGVAPLRLGIGLGTGVSIGYLPFTHEWHVLALLAAPPSLPQRRASPVISLKTRRPPDR
jgi:hypothetical protein